MRFKELGGGLQQTGAQLGRAGLPGGLSPCGRLHCLLNLRGPGIADIAQQLLMAGRVGYGGADGIGGMHGMDTLASCAGRLAQALETSAQHTVIAQVQTRGVAALFAQQLARQHYAGVGQAYVIGRKQCFHLGSGRGSLPLSHVWSAGAAIKSEMGQSGLAMRCTNELLAPFSSRRRTR
jgi:hypothetical protein